MCQGRLRDHSAIPRGMRHASDSLGNVILAQFWGKPRLGCPKRIDLLDVLHFYRNLTPALTSLRCFAWEVALPKREAGEKHASSA